jgi:hypothetical protein
MDRRYFSRSAIASLALLPGYDLEQKPAATATMFKNREAQETMEALVSAISGLRASVGEFQSGDWKVVEPSLEESAEEISSAFQRLRTAHRVAGT